MKMLSQSIILIITVLLCTAAAEVAQDAIADAVQDTAATIVQDTINMDIAQEDVEAATSQDVIAEDIPQDIVVDTPQDTITGIAAQEAIMDIAQEETVAAQDLPRIAVYVTGNLHNDEKTALGTRLLASLVNSGRYRGIERSNLFLAEIEREHVKQRSGAIDDSQISELGKQFGVKHICIATITPILGSYQISARIVDVETAEVAFIGEAYSPLRMVNDFTRASDEVVRVMFGEQKSGAGGQPIQQTKVEITLPQKPTFWVATSLDILGAGLIAYGIIENENVKKHIHKNDVERSAKSRNIAYAVGAAALLAGVSIHIFF